MKRSPPRVALTLLLHFFLLSLAAQPPATDGFELRAEEDGVRVYVRPETNGDLSVRVVTRARTQVRGVYRMLNESADYPEWVHRCSYARHLPGGSTDDYRFVSGIDLPFPLRDREVVGEVRQRIGADGVLTRTIRAVPDAIPPTAGVERQRLYDAEWLVSPASGDAVRIQCTVRTDAGAGLPGWLRREIMTGGPVKTLINLRRRLEAAAP